MYDYMIYPKEFRKVKIPVEKNTCFFLMPFNEEFDMVYGEIKSKLTDIGVKCSRVDEENGSYPIISKVIKKIIAAQFIIVDLSNSNPNVFYELGIAHTFKDARNILLIKNKNDKAPFDITHLKYTEYSLDNLKLLTSKIKEFIDTNKNASDFYYALNINGIINIIDDNNNFYIEKFQNYISKEIVTAIKILNNEFFDIEEDNISALLNLCKNFIFEALKDKDYGALDVILTIYAKILNNASERIEIEEYINDFLTLKSDIFNIPDEKLLSWKTDFAVLLSSKKEKYSIVLDWIIDYFKRSKSGKIDLNRYKLEKLIMEDKSENLNNAIINAIKSNICYIREHMADIIGDKKLEDAFFILCNQLENEDNYFTASSMITAIGKLENSNGIECINKWIDNNISNIVKTNSIFVLNHARISIEKLDKTNKKVYLDEFMQKHISNIKDKNFI